ncbi:MAG: coproporphyrinogen III oxidase family protein [Verrucomicrobia bacterium]|nr:coproporphyrinogen III oxidase family protein [Verrucomicrobiota bacterium]
MTPPLVTSRARAGAVRGRRSRRAVLGALAHLPPKWNGVQPGGTLSAGTALAPHQATEVGNYFISNYPPYSRWNAGHNHKFLHKLARMPEPEPLDLYVHLPFCRQHCHYCYFRVHPRREAGDVNRYLDAILKELDSYGRFPALRNRRFGAVYFGGGSPSYLEPDQIRRLLGGLQERSPWDAVEECTFECEPGTVTAEKLDALKSLGVTRLSIGFQSLNDEILDRAGRDDTSADCLRAFREARDAGFDEINIDLIAGLPGETDETWRQTVEQVLALAPECVTIYQLELTYNSALFASIRAGQQVNLPDWTAKRRWVQQAFQMCEETGYVIASGYAAVRNPQWWRFVYTVDHFWHGADCLGLGESAFGHIQGIHYQNLDTFEDYTGAVESRQLPLKRALRLHPEEKLRREVILLLKTGCLDVDYFRDKFKADIRAHFRPQFERLAEEGFMEIDSKAVRLTRKGLLQVDTFLPILYLPEHAGIRYT